MSSNFYSKSEINNAEKHSLLRLLLNYLKSESRLKKAAKTGDVRKVETAMKFHHFHEYSYLYKKGHSNEI